MNYLEFKQKFNQNFNNEEFNQENYFIVGLDLGNSSACISYYDFNTNKAEVMNLSGGYGNASIPMVVQYIPNNDEWIIGEYAMINPCSENEIVFYNLIEKMGQRLTTTINQENINPKTISYCYVLSVFIKEALKGLKNINPKAEICGIIISTEPYISDDAKAEIYDAIQLAGFSDEFIGFREQRECILRYYIEEIFNKDNLNNEVIIFDYGERAIRGNLFKITKNNDTIDANCELFLFDKDGGTAQIDLGMKRLFSDYYLNEKNNLEKTDLLNEHEIDELNIFTYQHKDLFLQNIDKGIKLYYNFCYPPIKKNVKSEDIKNFILPFKNRFFEFLKTFSNIQADIITVGGGFEQNWSKKLLLDVFQKKPLNDESKTLTAKGTCLMAVEYLGVIQKTKINIIDNQRIKNEVGVIVGDDEFIPLAEKNSFWWKEHNKKYFIIDEDIKSTNDNTKLSIFKKSQNVLDKLYEINLKGIGEKQKRIARISMQIIYNDWNKAFIEVIDCGFGEFSQSNGYIGRFEIEIN